jgi:hypothetical protein
MLSPLTPHIFNAARDLRRVLISAGSDLLVRAGSNLHAEAAEVAAAAAAIGATVVYVNRAKAKAALGVLAPYLRIIVCPGENALLCEAPRWMPRLPGSFAVGGAGVLQSCVVGVGVQGETTARLRLALLVNAGSSYTGVSIAMWRELRLGCVSVQRIRTEIAAARQRRGVCGGLGGLIARKFGARASAVALFPSSRGGAALLAIAAFDVDGGDRRGIEWDEKAGAFRLKEWEHAETERQMNAKQRGSEFVRRRKMFLERAFFPEDVTPDYYSFTAWRFAQRCVSSTVGVFGTQALLLALGVKSGRIGQAAAISWVLKDGLGRVGKMLWASGMGKDFDVDPKRWRFRSALLYAMGNGMEIVTQIFPASFLVLATIANSMKQVSMLTSSATRNAMYRSFSGQGQNIANITAKGEAQIVVADLAGMVTGIWLTKRIGTSKGSVLAAYSILTALDIVGIYMELRQVVFRTLNAERSSLILQQFVETGKVILPSDVSRVERIFLKPLYKSRSRFSSISKAAGDPEELDTLLRVFRRERFLVTLPHTIPGPCRVVLRKDAHSDDVLRALLTVSFLQSRVRNGRLQNGNGKDATAEYHLRTARRAANKAFPDLIIELRRAGWNVDHLLFGTVKRGAWWGSSSCP